MAIILLKLLATVKLSLLSIMNPRLRVIRVPDVVQK